MRERIKRNGEKKVEKLTDEMQKRFCKRLHEE